MKTVVSYLGGVPPSQKVSHKTQLLQRFVDGVNACGDRGIAYQGHQVINSDIAVIQGWVHEGSGSSKHLMLRRSVIETQKKLKKKTIIIDSNLFNYKGMDNLHWYQRYSADGVFPTTGDYFDKHPDPSRWQQISKDMDVSLKDWRTSGDHILICTQRNGGWSMKGLTVVNWLDAVVQKLQGYTDRPIIVRSHPGDRNAIVYLNSNNKKYKLSTNKSLIDDLTGAWAVITYNSSPGVAAAIEGVPTFVTDPNFKDSQACDVSNFNLADIENPQMKDRQPWIEKIAMCHWKISELQNGSAWRHMRMYV